MTAITRRVTDAEVKEIVSTTLDTNPFITTANVMVTNVLGSSTLDAATLKVIELNLAAHFVCLRDRKPTKKSLGDSSVEFEGKTGLGLDYTPYGQTVKLLDTTGAFSSLGLKRARVVVAQRTSPSEG